MNILAIDSSAKTVSASVVSDGRIVSEIFANTGYTHSVTLVPAIDSALRLAGIDVNSVDLFAVSNGPGSFTGIRIGAATVKGLAHCGNRPCIGVSTLLAMAYNLLDTDCIACCVMDARCAQVYTALFDCNGSKVTRLTEDSAMPIADLEKLLKNLKKTVFFVGDGAQLCYNSLKDKLNGVVLAAEGRRFQRASGVALAALDAGSEAAVEASALGVTYLRLSQAERELKKKRGD